MHRTKDDTHTESPQPKTATPHVKHHPRPYGAEDMVHGWVQKVMLGSVSILLTLLTGFIAWSIPTLHGIDNDTKLLSASQAYSSAEVSRLTTSQEQLNANISRLTELSHTWATRDQVQVTRDQMMEKITLLEHQLHDLKLRVALMERDDPGAL